MSRGGGLMDLTASAVTWVAKQLISPFSTLERRVYMNGEWTEMEVGDNLGPLIFKVRAFQIGEGGPTFSTTCSFKKHQVGNAVFDKPSHDPEGVLSISVAEEKLVHEMRWSERLQKWLYRRREAAAKNGGFFARLFGL